MFEIRTDGISYREGIPLGSAIAVLKNYGDIYDACLTESCVFNSISSADKPIINVDSVQRGSGEFTLSVCAVSAITPFLPLVYQTSWDYFQKIYSLIETLNKYKRQYGKAMQLTITDSPGAVVVFSGRDTVTISEGLFRAAKIALGPFGNIAKYIKDDKDAYAKTYYAQKPEEQKSIQSDNADDFISPDFTTRDDDPIELEVSIYKLNKKTLVGTLEYKEEDSVRNIPFVADQNIAVEAIMAMSANFCTIKAIPERRSNILGESKVIRLHIQAITNIK